MTNFKNQLVILGKSIVAIILLVFTGAIFLQKDKEGIYFGIGLLIFVTLPTIFAVYLKNGVIKKYPNFIKAWKILRVIYVIILFLCVAGLALGLYRAYQKNQITKAVEIITSTKITLDDVLGKNLPPEPDKTINDSTIAGIDANNNKIRDDVELEIFKKYPNSAKIRSAMLQYAQALQLELTQVANPETLIPVMQKRSSARSCIDDIGTNISINNTREEIIASLALDNDRKKEIDDIALNTDLRKKKQADDLNKYMTTYSVPSNISCDIELSTLSN